ncbi:MAG: hypothetical protein Q4B14_02645, partial [Clostridia bacterium]|nr:hypothetical protein [Clostridia bacterium]
SIIFSSFNILYSFILLFVTIIFILSALTINIDYVGICNLVFLILLFVSKILTSIFLIWYNMHINKNNEKDINKH